MNITFYYDYICPFCYIGTKRILKVAGEFDINIEWKGIEIHPDYSSRGLRRKKTPRLKHITETLREIAAEDDTVIELPGFITNSRLCLEGAEYAKTEGKFLEYHNACYEAYFGNKVNIGQITSLLEIAEKIGLDVKLYKDSLENRTYMNQINKNKAVADENLVLGVPTVYFDQLRIHGAQSVESYRKLIKKILSEENSIH